MSIKREKRDQDTNKPTDRKVVAIKKESVERHVVVSKEEPVDEDDDDVVIVATAHGTRQIKSLVITSQIQNFFISVFVSVHGVTLSRRHRGAVSNERPSCTREKVFRGRGRSKWSAVPGKRLGARHHHIVNFAL